MPEMPIVHLRMDPETARDLDALARKLHLNRTAAVRYAIARVAQLEGVAQDSPAPELEEGKAAA
jgi:predicted transcriptional regulator